MPILVPTSTVAVPDGTNVPSTNPWVGGLSAGDEVFFVIGSAARDPGGNKPDYDVILSDLSTSPPTNVFTLSPLWTQTNVQGNFTVTKGSQYGVFLEVGGGAPHDTTGTVFGFQVSAVYATPGFSGNDSSQLLQLQTELAPFAWIISVTHRNVVNTQNLTLQLSTTALTWTISSGADAVPTSGGNPNYYYTDSWCTPFQQYGFSRSTRVSFSPQLMMLPPVTQRVSFFLRHGIALDVFELTPGNLVVP